MVHVGRENMRASAPLFQDGKGFCLLSSSCKLRLWIQRNHNVRFL